MKAAFTVRPCKHPRYKFIVRGTVGGKSQPRYFNAKKEAEEFARVKNTELLNVGREGVEFPSSLRVAALDARDMLAPLGASLSDVVREYCEREARKRKSRSVGVVLAELIESRRMEGKSKGWLSQLARYGGRFSVHFADKMISEISQAEILVYLSLLGEVHPETYNHILVVITALFSFALSREYCRENVALSIEYRKKLDHPPEIFTPAQVQTVMERAPEDLLPFLALAFFSGIRTEELKRLVWSEVDVEAGVIEVPARKSKSARRRLVKIEPCLDSWLRTFKREPSAKIIPQNLGRRLHGFYSGNPEICYWPRNVARHSFCSYHLARFGNAATLALEMGHKTTSLIFEHYRNLVRPAAAASYWEISPATTQRVQDARQRPIWHKPPYRVARAGMKPGSGFNVLWWKAGVEHRKHFENEKAASLWAFEQNAPWFQGERLDGVDERRRDGKGRSYLTPPTKGFWRKFAPDNDGTTTRTGKALAEAVGIGQMTLIRWSKLPGNPGREISGRYNIAAWRAFAALRAETVRGPLTRGQRHELGTTRPQA